MGNEVNRGNIRNYRNSRHRKEFVIIDISRISLLEVDTHSKQRGVRPEIPKHSRLATSNCGCRSFDSNGHRRGTGPNLFRAESRKNAKNGTKEVFRCTHMGSEPRSIREGFQIPISMGWMDPSILLILFVEEID